MRSRVSVAFMRRTILLGLLILLSTVGGSIADRGGYGHKRRPVRVDWDSRGWQLLGEQTVNHQGDRDTIRVGRYEGRFNKLTLVVHDSDLKLHEFNVHFADRTTFSPRVGVHFTGGTRTHVIDLPPGEQVITHIDLRYSNIADPDGYNDDVPARVQVWGFKIADARPTHVVRPPIRVTWDSNGWELLGEQTVDWGNRGRDRDQIIVNNRNLYSQLTLVTLDSDLDMLDFSVTFGNNDVWRPAVRNRRFIEGTRTHVIDLPGDNARYIKHIDFVYKNVPGDYERARFQVWGRRGGRVVAPVRVWDDSGWTMLGEQPVNGRVDYDRIIVGRDEGRFRQLMIVVLDSDLDLLDFAVKFNRGAEWRPNVRQRFSERTRTRAINLPSDYGRGRFIKHIDIKYANLPGDRQRARVQVWGR